MVPSAPGPAIEVNSREICREMEWPRENVRRKRHKACKASPTG
jgi:hypothetical protein